MIRNASKKFCHVVQVLFVTGIVSACVGSGQPEGERSAFGRYVYDIDSLQLRHAYDSLLRADTSSWMADISVKEYYQTADDRLQASRWFDRSGVSADADSMLAVLRRELPRNGLDTTAFGVPRIAEYLDIVHRLTFDSVGLSINHVLPRLDYLLSKSFVRYTIGQRYGFTRPDKLLNRLNYREDQHAYAQLFDYAIEKPDYLKGIKQLDASDRLDYLKQSQPSGYVYQRLQQQLEKSERQEEIRLLAVNMERCRWRMSHPQDNQRMVVVNLPAQQLWAVGADSVLEMRICCGATNHNTPLLHSNISYMQVNPDWLIPQNIVKTDFLHHQGDSAWFARHRYYIVDRQTGDTLRVSAVSAEEMSSGKLRIGQKGGAGNALGRIVFRFKNNFDIYLHDTNMRGAFSNERRTLSHGCIRVQKPFELACFLLPEADEWTIDRLRISMDLRPETERGMQYIRNHQDSERPFRLMTYQGVSPHVPLYIVYYTVYPNPRTGVLETWKDIYGYDNLLISQMKSLLR